MPGAVSDIELRINSWFLGKSVTALERFDYHLNGIVVQRTRYITAYRSGNTLIIKKKLVGRDYWITFFFFSKTITGLLIYYYPTSNSIHVFKRPFSAVVF
jgi:hypothetical protein